MFDDTICLAVLTQYQMVTDRQIQTPAADIALVKIDNF